MKRILTILFILTISVSAFSLGISAGVGADAAYGWSTLSTTFGGTTSTMTISDVPLNFKGFIDFTYVEASVGYMMVNGYTSITKPANTTTNSTDKTGSLSLSLMAKYPFNLGPVTLFPLAGFQYVMNLSATDSSGHDQKAAMSADNKANLDQFWLAEPV